MIRETFLLPFGPCVRHSVSANKIRGTGTNDFQSSKVVMVEKICDIKRKKKKETCVTNI